MARAAAGLAGVGDEFGATAGGEGSPCAGALALPGVAGDGLVVRGAWACARDGDGVAGAKRLVCPLRSSSSRAP